MKTSLRAVVMLISTLVLVQVKAVETIYFLVADPRESDWALVDDSYVLPLSSKQMITFHKLFCSGSEVGLG